MRRLREQAWAKLNLDLLITGRRPDGYHELDSVVVFTGCADRLVFAPDDQLTLELSGRFGPALAEQSDNLVLQAARRLATHAGRAPHVRIALDKRLPVAAGLGGGSADAAAALRGLARLWRLDLSPLDLHSVALELGADVPVCLLSRSARMRGIGERIEPIRLPVLELVLAHPAQAVSTARVFADLGPIGAAVAREQPVPTSRGELLEWLRERRNDLEPPARRLVPVIAEAIAAIGAQPGCHLARMSGSGATCFGVFDDAQAAARAAQGLRLTRPAWWVISTATRA
jgi:4-diphosphocytidyl-2-C-methyl-D-erythritol kinase